MNALTALLNSIAFPVSVKQAEVIAISRCLDLEEDLTPESANSRSFLLAKADCIRLILTSPNVSEGGVSISWGDRRTMMSLANSIYSKFGEPLIQDTNPTVEFMKDW